MSSVIRPFTPPTLQPQTTPQARPSADARAAQRAFFQQALGDSTPVRAAPAVSAPVQAQAPVAAQAASRAVEPQVTRMVQRPIPDEPPTRIMRPGSFVDLKV